MATEAELLMDVCRESVQEAGLPADTRAAVVPFTVGGQAMHLRPMGAVERAKLFRWVNADPARRRHINAAVLALSVCDARGALLFDVEDVPEIAATFDGRAVEAVARRAAELNGV